MSGTDNTRPYEIQANDRRTLRVNICHNFPVPVIGGFRGIKRNGKSMRKDDARQRRQRDRQVNHNAKYLLDKDTVDILPIRADRRSLLVA